MAILKKRIFSIKQAENIYTTGKNCTIKTD
jgi:hypothetical protein